MYRPKITIISVYTFAARHGIFLSYLLIYCILFYLCALTPMVCDDYSYWPYWPHFPAIKYDLGWILNFQYLHWQHVHGRIVAHTIMQTFVLAAPWIHVVFTPLVFCLTIYLSTLVMFGNQYVKYKNMLAPLFIFSCLWLFVFTFGENYLWRTGSANYLYTTCLALLYLYILRKILDDHDINFKKIWILPWCFLSLCAGWTNENLGILCVLCSFSLCLYLWIKYKLVKYYVILGLLFALIGWLMLILAPGQIARIHNDGYDFLSKGIWYHLTTYFEFWEFEQKFFLPLTIICLVGFVCRIREHNSKLYLVALFSFFLAQLSLLAFIASPALSHRGAGITVLFLSITALYIVFTSQKIWRYLFLSIALLVVLFATKSIINDGIIDFWKQDKITQQRNYELTHSKDPIIPQYRQTTTRYFSPLALPDFDLHLLHPYLALFYNLNSITINGRKYILEKPGIWKGKDLDMYK